MHWNFRFSYLYYQKLKKISISGFFVGELKERGDIQKEKIDLKGNYDVALKICFLFLRYVRKCFTLV